MATTQLKHLSPLYLNRLCTQAPHKRFSHNTASQVHLPCPHKLPLLVSLDSTQFLAASRTQCPPLLCSHLPVAGLLPDRCHRALAAMAIRLLVVSCLNLACHSQVSLKQHLSDVATAATKARSLVMIAIETASVVAVAVAVP